MSIGHQVRFYSVLAMLCVVVLVSGCGSSTKTSAPDAARPEPEPLVFSVPTASSSNSTSTVYSDTTSYSIASITAQSGEVSGFALKKNGVDWKTIPAQPGESKATIARITKKNLYIAPEIEGLGGYILYEAMPSRLVRIDLATKEDNVFQFGGVFQDVSADEKNQLWLVAGQGSLSFVVYDTIAQKKVATFLVDKRFSQAGNGRFSPDGKSFAYAAALGIPDRDGGRVVKVDIAKKQQTTLVEDVHVNKVPHIYGWKTNATIDYRFE